MSGPMLRFPIPRRHGWHCRSSFGLLSSAIAIALICALEACAHVQVVVKSKEIHAINRLGGWRGNVLGNSLVNMYANCGVFGIVYGVLYELPIKDVVSWSSHIARNAHHGQGMEEVRCDGIPDAVTFLSALKACADIRAIDNGKEIHEEIVTLGVLEGDVVLGML